ncbi:MAG: ATP-dependent Clp protease ATP-binding subunit, partial [Oscillospiraceae bacterium]|nr:ATP-dependent Clp protease ATP-binding subunit [Oscillospiraceae bacterium]
KRLGFSAEETNGKVMTYDDIREAVMGDLKKTFKPEFLNRVDDIIVFHQLTDENIREIAGKMIGVVRDRVEGLGVKLECTDEALDAIAKKGFDPVYGARPLRREIQNSVEDKIAELMLDGKLPQGGTAFITAQDGAVTVTAEAPEEEQKADDAAPAAD